MNDDEELQASKLELRATQAPQTSLVKKFADTAAAEGASEHRDKTAYLPIRVSPNAMQPVIIASFLFHELPMVVALFSPRVGGALASFLQTGIWFPLLYGSTVFVAAIIEVAESTPKQMTDYLNAVRLAASTTFSSADTLQHCRLACLLMCSVCHAIVDPTMGTVSPRQSGCFIMCCTHSLQQYTQWPEVCL